MEFLAYQCLHCNKITEDAYFCKPDCMKAYSKTKCIACGKLNEDEDKGFLHWACFHKWKKLYALNSTSSRIKMLSTWMDSRSQLYYKE